MKLSDVDLKALAEAEHSFSYLIDCLEELRRIDPVLAPRCDEGIDKFSDCLEQVRAIIDGMEVSQ